jgi:hypothetical protein
MNQHLGRDSREMWRSPVPDRARSFLEAFPIAALVARARGEVPWR